jgi:putative hydrolase of the HAD superfamily
VIRAIVFDGDDTLWWTEPLYDRAREEARLIVEAAGLDGEEWERLERNLDVENVQRLGHTVDRFPTSCVEAYEQLAARGGELPDPAVTKQVWKAASAAFEQVAPTVEGARPVLERLRRKGVRLALLTKGDRAVQERRIAQSGLADLFEVVEIVDEKTAEDFVHILDELHVGRTEAMSVGNSVRSDVLPAGEAGLQPIWIDAHVWEYERPPVDVADRVRKINELSDLVELLGSES